MTKTAYRDPLMSGSHLDPTIRRGLTDSVLRYAGVDPRRRRKSEESFTHQVTSELVDVLEAGYCGLPLTDVLYLPPDLLAIFADLTESFATWRGQPHYTLPLTQLTARIPERRPAGLPETAVSLELPSAQRLALSYVVLRAFKMQDTIELPINAEKVPQGLTIEQVTVLLFVAAISRQDERVSVFDVLDRDPLVVGFLAKVLAAVAAFITDPPARNAQEPEAEQPGCPIVKFCNDFETFVFDDHRVELGRTLPTEAVKIYSPEGPPFLVTRKPAGAVA